MEDKPEDFLLAQLLSFANDPGFDRLADDFFLVQSAPVIADLDQDVAAFVLGFQMHPADARGLPVVSRVSGGSMP